MVKCASLRTFCFIYTAQVGVVTLSCIGITLTMIAIVINIASQVPEEKPKVRIVSQCMFSIFIILCFVTYVSGILSVLEDQDVGFSYKAAQTGGLFHILLMIYWSTLTIIAITAGPCTTRYVCMYNRCADRWFIQPSGRPVNPHHSVICPGEAKSYHSGFIIEPYERQTPNEVFQPITAPSPIDEYTNTTNGNDIYGPRVKKIKCFTRLANLIINKIYILLIFIFLVYTELMYVSYANTIELYFIPPVTETTETNEV